MHVTQHHSIMFKGINVNFPKAIRWRLENQDLGGKNEGKMYWILLTQATSEANVLNKFEESRSPTATSRAPSHNV